MTTPIHPPETPLNLLTIVTIIAVAGGLVAIYVLAGWVE